MIVLIIIGALLFILALVNWEQSEGFFKKLFRPGNMKLEDQKYDFSDDEDYAYDDDNDYCCGLEKNN